MRTQYQSYTHREIVQHLLPTEQGDHADYGGPGDRQSIGVEICEFRNRARQSAAIDRAAHLTAALANRYDIPTARIVPHKHWRRVDFKYGKPCPRILLERDRRAPGGWRLGSRWERFVAQHRRRSEERTTARLEVGPYEIEPWLPMPRYGMR